MSYFLPKDQEPTQIPFELIEYLKERTSQTKEDKKKSDLREGDKVVVTGGPFEGMEGVFQRYMPTKERCRILLDVVGKITKVELPDREVNGVCLRD